MAKRVPYAGNKRLADDVEPDWDWERGPGRVSDPVEESDIALPYNLGAPFRPFLDSISDDELTAMLSDVLPDSAFSVRYSARSVMYAVLYKARLLDDGEIISTIGLDELEEVTGLSRKKIGRALSVLQGGGFMEAFTMFPVIPSIRPKTYVIDKKLIAPLLAKTAA